MIQLSIDGIGFFGLAALITAVGSLVWACRRHPKGAAAPSSRRKRLPPAE